MNLDESQRAKVVEWIGQGLKLSEIQNRLAADLGLGMTYMEVRLLVDDLKLMPKDVERPKPAHAVGDVARSATSAAPAGKAAPTPASPAAVPGKLTLSVDALARPGTVVSGKVTFSDGNKADWYMDQAGRLGLVPAQQGYRPPAAEVQQFQLALESELARLGL
jgi:hypothetical protein